jgi:hypothetical protein
MNWQSWFNALCYELGLWAVSRRPSLAFQPWFKRLMEHCRPDWAEWKTQSTLQQMDRQAKQLVEQWDTEERKTRANTLAKEAHKLFPDAIVTPLPDAIIPSVMIEKAPPVDASEAIKALGFSELRITYQLIDKEEP